MPDALDWLMLAFLFAAGACLGSFLNVVVFRLPLIEVPESAGWYERTKRKISGLSYPPSHCPRCGYALRWFDNFPVFGWVWLGGRCRKCKLPISVQYPLIEAAVGLLFAGFYAAFFLAGPAWGPPTPRQEALLAVPAVPAALVGEWGEVPTRLIPDEAVPPGVRVSSATLAPSVGSALPGGPSVVTAVVRQQPVLADDWPMLLIVLTLAWCLIAASLIDARHVYIPSGLSYLPAVVGLFLHTLYAVPLAPLSLNVGPVGCAWAVGGGVGWLASLVLLKLGAFKRSFAGGMPLLESDREREGHAEPTAAEWAEIAHLTRREMLWEVAFLSLPIGLGLACAAWAAYGPDGVWEMLATNRHASGFLGALLGGLVGGGVIWVVRVAGSLAFGREAMGLGDADLLFGVGCCLGAAPAGLVLFPAALVGLVFALYRLLARSRHELPFGPYLALAALAFVFFWNPVADYLAPSLDGLAFLLGGAAPLFGL